MTAYTDPTRPLTRAEQAREDVLRRFHSLDVNIRGVSAYASLRIDSTARSLGVDYAPGETRESLAAAIAEVIGEAFERPDPERIALDVSLEEADAYHDERDVIGDLWSE